MSDLLVNLRDHLVTQGAVRIPRVAGTAPPLFLDPKLGVPAPGEGQGVEVGTGAVLAAYQTGGIPARPYESFLRQDVVDIWIRVAKSPAAYVIEGALRSALIDRRDFDLGTERVVECLEWRALQRLGSDTQGFTYTVSYLFQRYARP